MYLFLLVYNNGLILNINNYYIGIFPEKATLYHAFSQPQMTPISQLNSTIALRYLSVLPLDALDTRNLDSTKQCNGTWRIVHDLYPHRIANVTSGKFK